MVCWAAVLGGCAGGPSREHIISESQFDEDTLTVRGLPWCVESRKIALKSFVAKNLCAAHNSALSPTDAAAKDFKRALDAIMAQPNRKARYLLNARLIERWVLKTTINCVLQRPGPVPDPNLVRRAFGLEPSPRGQGLFVAVEMGERVLLTHGFRFEVVTRKSDKQMVVAALAFHGVRALYAFQGAPAVQGAMRLRTLNWNEHSLRFRWEPDFDADDNVMT